MGKDPGGGNFYADSPTLLCSAADPAVAACFADKEQEARLAAPTHTAYPTRPTGPAAPKIFTLYMHVYACICMYE